MDNLCELNLRKFDRELRAELRDEAERVGQGLTEYCTAIFKQRTRPAIPAAPPTPPSNVTPIGPGMAGYWGPQTAGTKSAVATVEEPRAAKPKACPHGYMIRALCAQCRAS